MSGYICGIGGANVDFSLRSFAPVILRDSNPGACCISAGGVTRNILENLVLMGESCELISVFGDDLFGNYLREECAEQGIGTSHSLLCPGKSTTCYISMNDDAGDMLLGMSDMRLLSELTPERLAERLELLRGARAVVLDPNLPAGALEYLCSGVLAGVKLYADPVSTTYAKKLLSVAGVFHCIKPNRMELAAITGRETDTDAGLEAAVDILLERGCQEVAVSLGEKGCYWADRRDNRFYASQSPITHMANATGAGDAFIAGLIHGECVGLHPRLCVDMALSAGRLACLSEDTVCKTMSHTALLTTMEEYS